MPNYWNYSFLEKINNKFIYQYYNLKTIKLIIVRKFVNMPKFNDKLFNARSLELLIAKFVKHWSVNFSFLKNLNKFQIKNNKKIN